MAITTLSNYNAKRIMDDPFNEDMLGERKEIYNEVHGSEIYHLITVQECSASRLSSSPLGTRGTWREEMKGGTIRKGWWW